MLPFVRSGLTQVAYHLYSPNRVNILNTFTVYPGMSVFFSYTLASLTPPHNGTESTGHYLDRVPLLTTPLFAFQRRRQLDMRGKQTRKRPKLATHSPHSKHKSRRCFVLNLRSSLSNEVTDLDASDFHILH